MTRRMVEEKRRQNLSATTSKKPETIRPEVDLQSADDSSVTVTRSSDNSEDEDFENPHKSATKPKNIQPDKNRVITLALPCNPFKSEKISAMADRLNLSAGKRTAFMAAIISEGGADLQCVTLSKTSSRTAAKKL